MFAVRVLGDDRAARAFKQAGLKMRDLSEAWDRIGADIAADARPLIPVLTGKLARSLRQGKTRTQATVRAGNKRIPYAGPLNYGGTVSGFYGPHYIGPVHFLNKALEANRDNATDEVETEIHRILARSGLR